METINLKLSTSQNRALNQDGVTILRSLQFIQNETYQVNLAFLDGSTPVIPAIDSFTFSLRNIVGVDVAVVDSITPQEGDYPYSFTIAVNTPAIATALGNALYVDMRGVITYEADGETEAIQPITIRVFNTHSAGSELNFVSSINGVFNDVSITGGGSVSVSQSGQSITIRGLSPTGNFYPSSNPSGFITSSALTPYSLQSSLDTTGNALAGSIATLAAQTGTYYPASNPNGYISSDALAPYATAANLGATGSNLQEQVTALANETGSYAQQSTLANYVTAGPGATQIISGLKQFNNGISLNHINFSVGGFTNTYFYDGGGIQTLDVINYTLSNADGTTLDWNNKTLSDGWNLGDATGSLYPASNPSGFITSDTLAPYALESEITNYVSTTGNETIGGNKTFTNALGVNGLTFPIGGLTNTYFYNADGTPTLDFVNTVLSTSEGNVLNWTDRHLFGNWNLGTATGSLYPSSNPSGFAPTGYVNTVVAATGNTILAQVNNINNHTGDYYPKTNPSGFATTGYVNARILADDVRTLPGRSIHGMAMVNGCSSAAYMQFPDLILPEGGSYNIVFYPTKIAFTLTDVVPTSDVTIIVGEQGMGSNNLFSITVTSAVFVGGENRTIVIDTFEQGYFDAGVRTNGFNYSGGVISDIFLQVYPDTSNPFHSFVVYVEGFYGNAYNLQDSSVVLGNCSAESGGSSGGGGGF